MKKTKVLTAAFISLSTLAVLPLTAEAAVSNYEGMQVSVSSGYNQVIIGGTSQESLQAFLNSLNNSGCVTNPSIPSLPPMPPSIGLPGGNENNQPGESGTLPEQPEAPETGNNENGGQHAFAEEVVRLVNQERAKNGLQPLTLAANVQAAAQVRAREIQTSFSHTRPDGRNYATALQEQNVSSRGNGENIAWGQTSPEQVMSVWMNSAGHRKNILDSRYTTIGVGYYQGANGVNYWTQLFTY